MVVEADPGAGLTAELAKTGDLLHGPPTGDQELHGLQNPSVEKQA